MSVNVAVLVDQDNRQIGTLDGPRQQSAERLKVNEIASLRDSPAQAERFLEEDGGLRQPPNFRDQTSNQRVTGS